MLDIFVDVKPTKGNSHRRMAIKSSIFQASAMTMVVICTTFMHTVKSEQLMTATRIKQNEHGIAHQSNFTAGKIFDCDPCDHKIEPPITLCNFTISNTSAYNFQTSVSIGNEVIHLRLIFPENEEINSTKIVIQPKHWIWTDVENNGGKLYLALPLGFKIWSMTKPFGPININITLRGDCPLVIGNQESTAQLDTALMQLLDAISGYYRNEYMYLKRSRFCYAEQRLLDNYVLHKLCLHIICPIRTIVFKCCDYTVGEMAEPITCYTFQHSSDFWLWQCPFLVAIILFAFVPLQLMNFSQNCHDGIHRRRKNFSRTQYAVLINTFASADCMQCDGIIWETDDRPVTLLSMLGLQIMRCFSFRCTVVSRVARAMFPIFSMALVALNTLFVGLYDTEFVVHAVEKEVPLGFSSVLAGFYLSSTNFLPYLGGPYVACTAYVTIAAILMSTPNDLSKCLANALSDNNNVVTSLLRLDQASVEKHGFVRIVDKHGYRKVHSQMKGQCFMLLNPAFWKYVTQILIQRWRNYVACGQKIGRMVAIIVRLFIFIPYIGYCLCQIATALLFYGIPIINFTYTFMRANYKHIVGIQKKKSIFSFTRKLAACLVSVLALFVIFMFYIIFFDSFVFLARVVIYTYIAMFARPEECYGYIVVGIWVLYYLWQSVDQIGNVYQKLLKDTILVSQHLQSNTNDGQRKYIFHMNNTPGIPEELFEYVIKVHRPRIKEVFVSFVKVFLIILMMYFSVRILIRINKAQKMFLLTHIFQALFICMVPKLVTSFCKRADRKMEEKYYRLKLKRTIVEFWRDQKCVYPMQNMLTSQNK